MKKLVGISGEGFATCDRMPVNTPGHVQAYGALLVYNPKTREVLRASANFEALIPSPARTRKVLSDWLPPLVLVAVEGLEQSRRESFFAVPETALGREDGIAIWLSLHRHGNLFILEAEKDPSDAKPVISPGRLQQMIAELLLLSEENFYRALLDTVNVMMPFHRMMIYRFDERWNGQVIAERVKPGMPSYLNHWFPEGDIPKPARDMYLVNPVRVIADISSRPVEILNLSEHDTKYPLDLSSCFSRAAAPVHVEYLRNMGIEASTSFALLVRGRLWGILACHHLVPRTVNPECRAWVQLLLRTMGLKISELELSATVEKASARRRLQARLGDQLKIDRLSEKAGLEVIAPVLQDIVDAQGVAIIGDDAIQTAGQVPPNKWMPAIVDFVKTIQKDGVAACPSLAERIEDYRTAGCESAGVLAVALNRSRTQWLLWFRNSIVQEVLWGGDPRKPTDTGSFGGRIHPRKSFNTWKESAFFTAAPWTDLDVSSAHDSSYLVAGSLSGTFS